MFRNTLQGLLCLYQYQSVYDMYYIVYKSAKYIIIHQSFNPLRPGRQTIKLKNIYIYIYI